MSNPIPTPVQETLDLLASDLADVRFPGLEPAVVQGAMEQVLSSAAAVDQAEDSLERARTALAEAQESLLQKAQRALAYARIYAEDDPALADRLEAIVLPRSPRRSQRSDSCPEPETTSKPEIKTGGRRGRPRKAQASELVGDETDSAQAALTD